MRRPSPAANGHPPRKAPKGASIRCRPLSSLSSPIGRGDLSLGSRLFPRNKCRRRRTPSCTSRSLRRQGYLARISHRGLLGLSEGVEGLRTPPFQYGPGRSPRDARFFGAQAIGEGLEAMRGFEGAVVGEGPHAIRQSLPVHAGSSPRCRPKKRTPSYQVGRASPGMTGDGEDANLGVPDSPPFHRHARPG